MDQMNPSWNCDGIALIDWAITRFPFCKLEMISMKETNSDHLYTIYLFLHFCNLVNALNYTFLMVRNIVITFCCSPSLYILPIYRCTPPIPRSIPSNKWLQVRCDSVEYLSVQKALNDCRLPLSNHQTCSVPRSCWFSWWIAHWDYWCTWCMFNPYFCQACSMCKLYCVLFLHFCRDWPQPNNPIHH